jgi:hypothetical protein
MRKTVMSVAALAAAGTLGLGAAAVAAPAGGAGNGGQYQNGISTQAQTGDCDGTGESAAAQQRRSGNGAGAGGRRAGGAQGRSGQEVPDAVPGTSISDEVAAQLAYMVQEEQLARDIYQLAASLYSERVFTNISRSESTHLAAVQTLLDRYDVTDPTEGASAGQYADAGLQELYATLAVQVRTDRDTAVQAGITIEKTDIADLEEALALDMPADVSTVLANLQAASQRHLAAFQRYA